MLKFHRDSLLPVAKFHFFFIRLLRIFSEIHAFHVGRDAFGVDVRVVLVPASGVPDFGMVEQTDDRHIFFQTCKITQTPRNEDASLRVELYIGSIGEVVIA